MLQLLSKTQMRRSDWRITPQITAPNRITGWKKQLARFGVFAVWMLVWQVAAMAVGLEAILPTPLACLKALIAMLPKGSFWVAVAFTLGRIICGYVVGCVVGAVMGIAAYFVPAVGALLRPFMSVVRATPVVSFALLAWLWLSPKGVPILISSLMVIPVVFGNVCAGLESHSSQLREVAYVYGFSPVECMKNLFLPAVLPYFFAGCLTALGLSWKAGVAAEMLVVTENSIGMGLYDSKQYFEHADLFAWTAVAVMLSFLFEWVVKLIAYAGKRGAEGRSDEKDG
ncbi:MAG: ABC transporter permease subunit [Clostridia bacterium]|nr:ABC transporter permease subunit [Clostridia bacterium]